MSESPGKTPLRLVSISSDRSLLLNEEVLSALQINFKSRCDICPFLVLGHPQSGKSTLLDALLGQEGEFTSAEGEGLYVWPYPLDCSGTEVLLMEMNGSLFASRNDSAETLAEIATAKKLATIALAVSAVCGVCLEKTLFFANLNHILELGDIARAFLSPPSQYLAFVEEREKSKDRWVSEETENHSKYQKRNVNFPERGYDGLSTGLIQSIKTHLSGCSKDYQSIDVPPDQHSDTKVRILYPSVHTNCQSHYKCN